MNELLKAAKAVIDLFDDNFSIADCEHIDRLRAAVDRAEKQEAVGFNEWWERDYGGRTCRGCAEDAWKTAQQTERERCREIVIAMGGPDVPELLKQIDSGEE